MATFLTLQQELADRLSLDQTITANQTRLKRWLNIIQDDISGRANFTFLQERNMIQTVPDTTTGTVSCTLGSATVTGSSTAFASTDVGRWIQFSSSNDWYEITGYTSATQVTINPAFGSTSASGLTIVLRTVFYSLNTDVNRILSVRQFRTPIKMTQIDASKLDRYQPRIVATGKPVVYSLYRLDPTIGTQYAKQRQMSFFPSPDDYYNIEVRYTKLLSDLSADSDISQIPPQYHLSTLLEGAEWLGAKFLNDPKENQLKVSYENGIEQMKAEDQAHDDWFPILAPNDSQEMSRFLPFPTEFEQPR